MKTYNPFINIYYYKNMEISALNKLLDDAKENSYFFLECKDWNYNRFGDATHKRKVVFIALPQKVRDILFSRTAENIKVSEMVEINNSETLCNIYIYPKYPPFQEGQRLFSDMYDCMPAGKLETKYLPELMMQDGLESLYHVRKFLELKEIENI